MSNAPIWVTLVAGLGSGTAGTGIGVWQGRKLMPATKRHIEAEATRSESEAVHTAMQTVQEALNIARGRIESLQSQVTHLTRDIGELREQLASSLTDRVRVEEALNIALTDRAKLQEQITDLNRRVGARRVDDLTPIAPPDAVVMIDSKTGKIVYANDGIYALAGYVPSQLVGNALELLVPEDMRELHSKQREDYVRHPVQRAMGTGLPLYVRPNGGGKIPVDISLHPTGDGRVIALMKRRAESQAPSEVVADSGNAG